MNDADKPNTDDTWLQAFWHPVSLPDYQAPGYYSASAARIRWLSLKRLISTRFKNEPDYPVMEESQLKPLTSECLERWVGAIDWRAGINAMDVALDDWWNEDSEVMPVRFFVCPPHSLLPDLLKVWADYHNIKIWVADDRQQILSKNHSGLDHWPGRNVPWLLPHLEHHFLRHVQGLSGIRKILAMATSGELGKGIIALDSWALTYLRQIGVFFPEPMLTLPPFDGEKLAGIFFQWVTESDREMPTCRHARSGRVVLSRKMQQGENTSSDLKQLAVYCRGNLGLARYFWRQMLKAEPDPEQENNNNAAVWLSEMPNEPVLPPTKGDAHTFILHALLVHNGVPAFLLPELTPLRDHQVQSVITELSLSGFLEKNSDAWRVSARGYIPIRNYLRARDFVVDDC